MSRALVTAFEPYDIWEENASWLTLVELTKDLPERPHLTTRRYPVDYSKLRECLSKDLAMGFDFVLHLGQAPGSCGIRLETVGLNQASHTTTSNSNECVRLIDDGPMAYQSRMPATALRDELRAAGIPAEVSTHAGTYLCNAALYLAHHAIASDSLTTKAIFVHLPLDVSQAAKHEKEIASLPASVSAEAVRIILSRLAEG